MAKTEDQWNAFVTEELVQMRQNRINQSNIIERLLSIAEKALRMFPSSEVLISRYLEIALKTVISSRDMHRVWKLTLEKFPKSSLLLSNYVNVHMEGSFSLFNVQDALESYAQLASSCAREPDRRRYLGAIADFSIISIRSGNLLFAVGLIVKRVLKSIGTLEVSNWKSAISTLDVNNNEDIDQIWLLLDNHFKLDLTVDELFHFICFVLELLGVSFGSTLFRPCSTLLNKIILNNLNTNYIIQDWIPNVLGIKSNIAVAPFLLFECIDKLLMFCIDTTPSIKLILVTKYAQFKLITNGFDCANDYFKAALAKIPNDYSLWLEYINFIQSNGKCLEAIRILDPLINSGQIHSSVDALNLVLSARFAFVKVITLAEIGRDSDPMTVFLQIHTGDLHITASPALILKTRMSPAPNADLLQMFNLLQASDFTKLNQHFYSRKIDYDLNPAAVQKPLMSSNNDLDSIQIVSEIEKRNINYLTNILPIYIKQFPFDKSKKKWNL